jgi:hypothetical protein
MASPLLVIVRTSALATRGDTAMGAANSSDPQIATAVEVLCKVT